MKNTKHKGYAVVTAFGKFLRSLRLDIGELLLDMAEKLDVSSTFLSGVENGKRKIPSDWVERISSLYCLSAEKKTELQEAFYDANNAVEIGLTNLQQEQRDLVFAFARKLESIPNDDMERIRKILNKK